MLACGDVETAKKIGVSDNAPQLMFATMFPDRSLTFFIQYMMLHFSNVQYIRQLRELNSPDTLGDGHSLA